MEKRNKKGQFIKGVLQKTIANTKGAIPWNKGLKGWNNGHVVLEETRRKISDGNRGKIMPAESKKKLSDIGKQKIGVLNSFYGKKHSENSLKRMRLNMKGRIPWNMGMILPQFSGKNHPNWKGGVSKQKGYHRSYANAYRARKFAAIGSFTKQEWDVLKKKYNYMCLCCKQQEPFIELTADHVIPLICGGTNFIENIQPLCSSCNCRKHMKTFDYRILYAQR